MKRALKWIGIGLGSLILLGAIAAVITLLVVDIDKLVNEQVAALRPRIEEKLGRKIAIGTIETHLFPSIGVDVADLSLGPDPARAEDDRPLFEARSVGVDLSLWRAVLSLGRNLSVNRIEANGVKLSVVRYKDGSLSYEQIIDRLSPPGPAEAAPEAEEGLSPDTLKLLQSLSIASIRLGDAELRLADDSLSATRVENIVRHLNLHIENVALEEPITLHLDAAAFAEQKNLELDLVVGPIPKNLDISGIPPFGAISLKADKVDLSKLFPYFGADLPKLETATLSSALEIGASNKNKPFDIVGKLELGQVKFEGGVPFDFRFDTKSRVDPKSLSVDIDHGNISLGVIALEAKGKLRNLASNPEFEAFQLRSQTLDPGALLLYYPEARKSLPTGSVIEGKGDLALSANGSKDKQTVAGGVDLTNLKLLIPGALSKPAGVPLKLAIDGDLTGSDAILRQLALQLDELNLGLAGTVKSFAKPVLDLTLKASPFRFDRIVRLAPSVASALAASGTSAQGTGAIDGAVKGTTDKLDARLAVALTDTALDTEAAAVKGNLKLDASLVGDLASSYAAKLNFDGDRALLRVPNTISKAVGVPFNIKAEATRAGSNITIDAFRVALANLSLTATGGFDLAKGTTAVKMSFPRLDLEQFAKTVTAIPADLARGGFFETTLSLAGNPNDLSTMALSMNPFKLQTRSGSASGSLSIANLAKPSMKLDLSSPRLDLDPFFPPSTGDKPTATTAAKDQPGLKDYRFDGNLSVAQLRFKGQDIRNLKAKVTLANGLLKFQELTLNAFGGSVVGSGTEAEIWRGVMPYKAQIVAQGLEANQALSAMTRYKNVLSGRTNLNLSVVGKGFETKELERSLQGQVTAEILDGTFSRGNLTRAILGNIPALVTAPGSPLAKLGTESRLRALKGLLRIQDGKMMLQQPVPLTIDNSRATLSGGIGIAGGLALQGDYFLQPQMLSQATGGFCKATSEVKIPIQIGGDLLSPQFKPDASAIARNLVPACLTGKLAGAAEAVLGKDATKNVEKKVEEAKSAAQKKAADTAKKATEKAAEGLKGLLKR